MQVMVYVPHSGEIWAATPQQPDAALMATVPRGLFYPLSPSPDGSMLAVNGPGELIVMNADGSNMRTFDGLQTQAWVTWSADRRRLLISPFDIYSRESARVIDLTAGQQTVLDDARLAISCESGYVAITEEAGGFGVTRISENGESSAVLDAETLDGLEPAGIIQLMEQSCEWLVILNRRGEALLVHPASGQMFPLGNGFPIISVDGGALSYGIQAGDKIEIRRLDLKTGAQPEVLWRYPRTFEEVLWLDDSATRGLSVESGLLNLIEPDGPFVIPLNGALAEFYSLLED
jgi:hypothetical protein